MAQQAGAESNRTLARAASILDAVAVAPRTAAELATHTGLSPSTAHRLAVAMVEYGFLRRTEEGSFVAGERIDTGQLAATAQAVLERLRDEFDETAQLWVRRGSERVCLLSADSRRELRVTLPVGARIPLPSGSAGQVLDNDKAALESIASRGWHESIGARTPELASVSAPVYEGSRIVAAVCVALPRSRVLVSPGADFGDRVAAAARSLSSH